jgi:hypothetical protein
MTDQDVIRTPDQRVRVFVSSTLTELAAERPAVREGGHDSFACPWTICEVPSMSTWSRTG